MQINSYYHPILEMSCVCCVYQMVTAELWRLSDVNGRRERERRIPSADSGSLRVCGLFSEFEQRPRRDWRCDCIPGVMVPDVDSVSQGVAE